MDTQTLGFLKRAQQYGVTEQQADALLEKAAQAKLAASLDVSLVKQGFAKRALAHGLSEAQVIDLMEKISSGQIGGPSAASTPV